MEDFMPELRECTRCEGIQELVAFGNMMGVYECETCELRIGFDLLAEDEPEFFIHRGKPWLYEDFEFFVSYLIEKEYRIAGISDSDKDSLSGTLKEGEGKEEVFV